MLGFSRLVRVVFDQFAEQRLQQSALGNRLAGVLAGPAGALAVAFEIVGDPEAFEFLEIGLLRDEIRNEIYELRVTLGRIRELPYPRFVHVLSFCVSAAAVIVFTPPATPVPDLFQPNLQDWVEQPVQIFEHQLIACGYRESSATVYHAMWHKWLRWAKSHQRVLVDWSVGDIAASLDESGLTKLRCYRYVRLTEHVFHQIEQQRMGTHNPASSAIQQKLTEGENDSITFFSLAERAVIEAPLEADVQVGEAAASVNAFKLACDHTLIAVCHDAGLKAAQVQSLLLRQMDESLETIAVERLRDPSYQAPVLEAACPTLAAWLATRTYAEMPGERIFVADAGECVIYVVSVYQRVEAWLATLSMLLHCSEQLSPQTLRNGYTAALFDIGADSAEMGCALGLCDAASVWRLRTAYAG